MAESLAISFIKDFLIDEEQKTKKILYHNTQSKLSCECKSCLDNYEVINDIKIKKSSILKKQHLNFIESNLNFYNFNVYMIGNIYSKVYFKYNDVIEILKQDNKNFKNNFNLINIQINTKIFSEIKESFEELLPNIKIYYKNDTDLFIDYETLLKIQNLIITTEFYRSFVDFVNMEIRVSRYSILHKLFKEIDLRDKIIDKYNSYENYVKDKNYKNQNEIKIKE